MVRTELSKCSLLGKGNAITSSKQLKIAPVSESLPKWGLVPRRVRSRKNQKAVQIGTWGKMIENSARLRVKKTLRLFSETCRKVLQEHEAKPQDKRFRQENTAAKLLKSKGLYPEKEDAIIGNILGVEVGDEFRFRMELNLLRIHRPIQSGIDSREEENGTRVATSIVSSGRYNDDVNDSDVVVYTGQGGNIMRSQKKGHKYLPAKDQKLEKGNLALFNSITTKNPVRVIRGKVKKKKSSSSDANNEGEKFVYDGLYLVEKYWEETAPHGKRVFKFKLMRIPGQPKLSWKAVEDSKKNVLRFFDIARGKERFPIYAVNDIDDEKPPQFTYMAKMEYPEWCKPLPPKRCGCTKPCSDESNNCSCIKRNEKEESPYNHDGAIVHARPVVYECGPQCKCSDSCYLRVTQLGIKIQLEVFKTESRGWGVRSLNSISSGSFICEYVGELLEDNEAEKLTGEGEDVYLFDIGKKCMFVINPAHKGNVGRFINHSCSPNLYAQEVLYDHRDKRLPHIMFFAQDNIPPLQELTFDYGINQVTDANGNVKKKICYCGSDKCSTRLY